MDSSLGPNASKLALVESILRHVGQRWALPQLRLGGFVSRGGAQIRCATGEVLLDKTALEGLSASTLEAMMAHEAGHLRSYRRRRSFRRPQWWLDRAFIAAWLGAVAALALGQMGLVLLLLVGLVPGLATAWPREPTTRERLEEEIRADAFACCHLEGGVAAWNRAVRQYAHSTGSPALHSGQLALRRAAIHELSSRGLLRQVGLYPERALPALQCWPRPSRFDRLRSRLGLARALNAPSSS